MLRHQPLSQAVPPPVSGASLFSGCGTSGTCSSGGSVTITQSGTMTAYATRNGYAASNTASKSCTMALPTPSVSVNRHTEDSDNHYAIIVSNWKSFPDGTTFSGKFTIDGDTHTLGSKTKPDDSLIWSTVEWNISFTIGREDGISATVTASCAGYASSTGTYS